MFGFLKKDSAYKQDNLKLMGQVSSLSSALADCKEELEEAHEEKEGVQRQLTAAQETIEKLDERIKELENDGSVKVTYAQARKTLTKAKLKAMRDRLEAVPAGAQGFQGSVSVYDKKTKRLSVVQLTSKDQALEILSRAEKGNVDIVI